MSPRRKWGRLALPFAAVPSPQAGPPRTREDPLHAPTPKWEAVAFWSRRRRTEEALGHLAAIVESSDDAILSKTLEGVIQSVNAAAERLFGYSARELVGRPVSVLIPPERRHEEAVILERVRRGERIEHFETVRLTKQGRAVEVSLTISPIRAASGAIVGASKIARDITERKRAERALHRAQQVSRFMANASVALADLSDTRTIVHKVASLSVPFFADWCAADIVRENAASERLVVAHDDPRSAALAREVARRWLPDPGDGSGPGRVAATGRAELVEDARPEGQVTWVRGEEHRKALQELGFASYLCVPVSSRGRTQAVLTFVQGRPDQRYETTDLRVAEALAQRTAVAIDNAELYRSALEADHRKDDFLAVLSHELRTPLNAIVGWSHIIRDGTADAATVRKAAETIHRNAQVQARLISDILDISRIVAGKMRLDVHPVDLCAVIEAALDTLKPAAGARGVRLEAILDRELESVAGDANRLQQIVWNLVSNAIKFVPERTGRVEVRLEARGDHLRITVDDNGPGIDAAFLPHVFDRFRQEETGANRRSQGLGLGLALVRQLVELHGGAVHATNLPGRKGARFTVQLPRQTVARAVEAAEATQARLHVEQPLWLEQAPSLGGVRVLVVDDHADARDVLKAVLERCGATVVVASSAREALASVRTDRPDVVLSDVEMPEQNGYDLLRALRSLPAEKGGQTPAVALTAYASAHDRVKLLRAGFQMHVPKPVQPAELATVVASLARKDA
jgi:PAS domain S-box-containing protein